MSQPASEISLYERIGGAPAIRIAVNWFLERVLADPTLHGFFENVETERLKSHQLAFLSQILGGPSQYSGASMRNAHRHLRLGQRHFDSVAVHLMETLRKLGVSETIIAHIGSALTPLALEIVNTTEDGSVA